MQQHATPKAHSHTFDAFNILWKVCVLRSPSHVYFCCLIDESGAADDGILSSQSISGIVGDIIDSPQIAT
jgi:hypothetical protein